MEKKVVRIGTRGSLLAVAQTEQVIAAMQKKFPDIIWEKVILRTRGDELLNKPLADFGGKGVFVTAFEEALQQGNIDLAVHSAKDMPTELAPGMVIAGVTGRADARDVLVTRKGGAPPGKGMVVGTGSLRRQMQLNRIYPEVECKSIRGNVPTRLDKVRQGECDGVVLAAAGLQRLGLLSEPDLSYRYFSFEEMVPSGGQGIIAIEGRAGEPVSDMVRTISDQKAYMELEAERSVLRTFDAGCHETVGILTVVKKEQMTYYMMREQEGRLVRRQGTIPVEKRLELAQQIKDLL